MTASRLFDREHGAVIAEHVKKVAEILDLTPYLGRYPPRHLPRRIEICADIALGGKFRLKKPPPGHSYSA
jgi:hypothetical protein